MLQTKVKFVNLHPNYAILKRLNYSLFHKKNHLKTNRKKFNEKNYVKKADLYHM